MGEKFTLNSDNRILGGTKCITILHNSNVNKYSVAPQKKQILYLHCILKHITFFFILAL